MLCDACQLQSADGVILAVICNLPVENRFRINLLNPQTTVLTLDLQIVARVTRGGKPVPTSVPRAINQREKYLLFVGHWFLPGGILFLFSVAKHIMCNHYDCDISTR